MKFLRFIYKVIINPIIGPIVVASTTLILLAIFYLPSLSLNNQKEKITRESKEIVHHLKTFRSYYNEFVVSKVENLPDIIEMYRPNEVTMETIKNLAKDIYNKQVEPLAYSTIYKYIADSYGYRTWKDFKKVLETK